MSSLLALLSQQTPNLKTRKALILLGLQNDFVMQDGKIPVHSTAFVDNIANLVPAFRQYGDIIWVRSEYEADRPISGPEDDGNTVITGSRVHDDEELFLSRSSNRAPGCLKGTYGADFTDSVKTMIQTSDMKIVKSHYSAFRSTNLLMTLRSKLITEVYLCGCLTNISVYATAVDAARYGITIYLVEDCLGYRKKERHEQALKRLHNFMEADSMTVNQVIAHLKKPPTLRDYSDEEDSADDDDDEGEEEEEEEEQNEFESQDVQHYASSPSDGLIATDSDQSDDEIMLPSLSGLNMREQGRDTIYPRPLSSRSLSHTVDRRLLYQSSQHTSSRSSTKPRNRDSKLNSPAQSEKSNPSNQSQQCSPTAQGSATQRHLNVTPSKRDLNSMEQRENLSRSAPAHVSRMFTPPSGTPEQRRKSGYDGKQRSSPYLPIMSSSISAGSPLFGEANQAESEGSRILHNLLPAEHTDTIFDEINREVAWERMFHQTGEVPRLVCCQGTFDTDGSYPVYRHPSDQSPPLHRWTSAVDHVRQAAEAVVGHPLNHALIQLYRGGTDFISEHSDKTLDVAPESFIVNVSFGAQRTMRLRTKRGAMNGEEQQQRTTHRIPLPHNSLLAMSLATNAVYLHGINADKRREAELSDAERAYGGQRISLTFRHIGTFLNSDASRIWGLGAVGKTKEDSRPVINGDPALSEKVVRAFGAENQASKMDRAAYYGDGFDVLHLKGI